MARSIEFEAGCQYSSDDGIEIPTELSIGKQKVELIAKLDTGAARCIVERRYGEQLGLDVEAGRAQRFRTMAGSFVAYQPEVDWVDRPPPTGYPAALRRLHQLPAADDEAALLTEEPDSCNALDIRLLAPIYFSRPRFPRADM